MQLYKTMLGGFFVFLKEKSLYKATIYIRLSKEDGDKVESNSVTNQRNLIKSYLKDKEDIEVVNERVDDGYSGVTFDRPALSEMLRDIKNGTINCVIVKDLSRFGRNYIETGRYIEQIFPFMGVRFIAINDNIDSAEKNTQSDSIIVPFKNLMNDSYSHDISIKARTQLAMRQKRGDFVGAFPVYGYFRSSENKNKLVIDEVAAETVKEIFAMRIGGHNNHYIAKHLNDLGIPSPLEYKQMLDFKLNTSFKLSPVAKWSHAAVGRILKNETYTGVLLQGKETTLNYKVKKRIKQSPENWIRVEDTHEAIIPKEDFAIAQKIMLSDTRTSPQKEQVYIFSGLLKCGDCGSNMVRKNVKANGNTYTYYVCSKNKADKNMCSSHRIRENHIEEVILLLLKQHINLVCSIDELLKQIDYIPYDNFEAKKKTELLLSKKQDFSRYNNLRVSVYEDYKDGILTKNEYIEMKDSYEKICSDIEKNICALEYEIETIAKNGHSLNSWVERFKNNQNLSELSRTTLVLLVDNIVILDSKNIKINFKYNNEFESALKLLEDISQADDAILHLHKIAKTSFVD